MALRLYTLHELDFAYLAKQSLAGKHYQAALGNELKIMSQNSCVDDQLFEKASRYTKINNLDEMITDNYEKYD